MTRHTLSSRTSHDWLRLTLLLLLSMTAFNATAAGNCSAYMGKVKLNEISIGLSGYSSTSNRIELFNSANVAASVWQTWQLVVYSKSSSTIRKRGGYFLSSGFTASGQFIYNNNKLMYLRNRNGRLLDIALVDQNGDFIDYLAMDGKIQTVPSCFGSGTTIDVTAASNNVGNVSRLPDGGTWPGTVTNRLSNTIGRTNVCSSGGNDLFVTNNADNASVLVNSTTVTYTVSVSNASCSNSIAGINLTDNNISATNFDSLSSTVTQGSLSQNTSSLAWNIGTLAPGTSATLTITGIPKNTGTIITSAVISSPTTGLINTGDDIANHSLTVRDYNYVGFSQTSAQVTEGVDTSFAATVASNITATNTITINYSVSGTATSSDTSLPATGSVTLNPTDPESPTEIPINFNILNDTLYEPSKTIVLTITSITSTDPAVRLDPLLTTMTITLNDDDSPTLIAEYHMDELAWSGTTDEVTDTSSFARSGAAAGNSGKASTQWTSPARNGSTGTCAYGYFAGGSSAQSVDMGPTNLGIGGTTGVSISAWVRWTVTPSTGNGWGSIVSNNPTSAADQEQFSLMHNSNNTLFEFALRTTAGRTYLFSTTQPQINQWYHVVAVYNGSQMALYVNGVLEATASKTGAIVADANLPLIIGRWGHSGTNYRAFQGNIDEIKIFNGPISAAQISNIYNETHPCPTYTNGNTPSNFNCVEVGSTPSGTIYSKLADSAFNLDVVAVKADGTVETGYVSTSNKTLSVELVDGSGSTACASRSVLGSLSQTASFASTSNGRKSVSFGPSNYAYPNVRCRLTDSNQTPAVQACSSDNFAIRPSNLSVASSASADPSGISTSATPAIKTNVGFGLTATSNSLGYNGTPKLDTTKLSAHTGAVQNGVVAGSFNAADPASGIASGSNFNYSEVGYFKLAAEGIYDDNFTGVDSGNGDCTADFSNTAVGGKFGCKFGNQAPTNYFGRFIPDHLQAAMLSNGAFAHACSGFSYNGQPIAYANSNHPMLNVTAYNNAIPAAITQNYNGSFARLQPGQITLTTPTSDALKKGLDNLNLLSLTATMATPSLTDNGNGNLVLILGNDSFSYNREANALIAPFNNSVAIPVTAITDSDGVSANNLPVTLQPSGENIRYGRINLMNAYGSELADLAVGMTAEYFNGSSFVVNAADLCSVATLTITDPLTSDALAPANTCIWDNNNLSGGFKCAGTAPSGESYLEGSSLAAGSFNLYLKAPGQSGPLTLNAAVANWLKFNWQGSGAIDPSTTASFGVFKGNDKVIYFREVY